MTLDNNNKKIFTHIGLSTSGFEDFILVEIILKNKYSRKTFSSWQLMYIYPTFEMVEFEMDVISNITPKEFEEAELITPDELTPEYITPIEQELMYLYGKNIMTIKTLEGSVLFKNDIYINMTFESLTPFLITPLNVIYLTPYLVTPRVIKGFNINN